MRGTLERARGLAAITRGKEGELGGPQRH